MGLLLSLLRLLLLRMCHALLLRVDSQLLLILCSLCLGLGSWVCACRDREMWHLSSLLLLLLLMHEVLLLMLLSSILWLARRILTWVLDQHLGLLGLLSSVLTLLGLLNWLSHHLWPRNLVLRLLTLGNLMPIRRILLPIGSHSCSIAFRHNYIIQLNF